MTMNTRKRRMTSAQILQEILSNSDSDISDAESTSYSELESDNGSSTEDESKADDGRIDNSNASTGKFSYVFVFVPPCQQE